MNKRIARLPGFSAEAALVEREQYGYHPSLASYCSMGRAVSPQQSPQPVVCMRLNAACHAGAHGACLQARRWGC